MPAETTVCVAISTVDAEYFSTIPVKSLRRPMSPLSEDQHARLVGRLQTALLKGNIRAAARLAAEAAFTHPCYGTAAKAAFNEAVAAWARVYVSVAVSPDGLGFAVGSEASAPELYAKLERGERYAGEVGIWPTLH